MPPLSRARPAALFIAGVVLTLLYEQPASANLAASAAWQYIPHLLIGNLFLGCLEGWIIARMRRWPVGSTVGLMMGANYLSSWLGAMFGVPCLARLADPLLGAEPLYRVVQTTAILTVLAFALTLAIEWPFCWFWRRKTITFGQWGWPMVVAHVASYALLVPYYVEGCKLSLYKELEIDRQLRIIASDARIYYLKDGGRTVGMMNADGQEVGKIAELSFPGEWLSFRRSKKNTAQWELWAHAATDHSEKVRDGLRGYFGAEERLMPQGGQNYYWLDREDVIDLRPKGSGNWEVCADIFAWYGLMVKPRMQGVPDHQALHIGFDTPFISWVAQCPNLLPGDQVIYQLGPQLMLVDLSSRRMRSLGLGIGPAVMLPAPPTSGADSDGVRSHRPGAL